MHRQHAIQSTFDITSRRGSRSGFRRTSGNVGVLFPSNPLLRVALGCVILYMVSILLVHSTVNTKDTFKMLSQRDMKHSPLMILRERDQSRRMHLEKEMWRDQQIEKSDSNIIIQDSRKFEKPVFENVPKTEAINKEETEEEKMDIKTTEEKKENGIADNLVNSTVKEDAVVKADADIVVQRIMSSQPHMKEQHRQTEHQTAVEAQNSASSNAKASAGTMADKKKMPTQKKKRRKLPKMDHSKDSFGPIEGDPLRAEKWPFESKKIGIKPAVEYLGTLIDGGRHYFSILWLKRVVDRLSDMNYNLIHLRLTDDQAFNLLLKSRPQLAYPQAYDNSERKVWTPDEMRDLTKYAKKKGVFIMPEVNVPGHAGAWYGIPDMVVHCPRFICERGYGLPLNVSHAELRPILTDVIKEIVDIFDDPPFLHLGGDEVNMADPCFHEVNTEKFNYSAFEVVLKEIIQSSGYPEDRVVRWEMTGQDNLERAGAIEQFWESHPGVRHSAKGKFFVSTWLYLDTNAQQDACDVYEKVLENFRLEDDVIPSAIIVGTFELSMQFWYDRNVLGRLLSVAIGASHPHLTGNVSDVVKKLWTENCDTLGLGDIICETEGRPVVHTSHYRRKWQQGWQIWKQDICDRSTETLNYKGFREQGWGVQDGYVNQANEYFWTHFPHEQTLMKLLLPMNTTTELPIDLAAIRKHKVNYTGVIIDAVSNMPRIDRIQSIIHDSIAPFGFNMVQLGLVGAAGFSYKPSSIPDLGHSILADDENQLYSIDNLSSLVVFAASHGVAIVPEITISTDATGWFNTGFYVDCPLRFCQGTSLPNNVNEPKLLSILYSVIGELRTVFNTSQLFHVGTDERSKAAMCWDEALEIPNYDAFESKMQALLALINLAPYETLRRSNQEKYRYPLRAGGVTQYPAGQYNDDDIIMTDEPFFLTIDLLDGDGYQIFESTKKAVALAPMGVLADLPKLSESKFTLWDIPQRLLAFAMGVSQVGDNSWDVYDAASFEKNFIKLCQALNVSTTCSPPPAMLEVDVELVTESPLFVQKQCESYVTRFENVRIAKKPILPWFDADGVARLPVVQEEGEIIIQ